MAMSKQSSGELKTRVNSCLSKLSDRDTLRMAANELETIARALPSDGFVPFLNCLSATDSSEKSSVRRQCVRLLGVLSVAHGDALSPHVSRMISTVIRRLRDPDSAVRSACVDAVSSIAAHVNSPPFTAILRPLMDVLFQEQDSNVQIGVSLCLSAAVEAAQEPDAAELRKILPRVLKLGKSDCFKAKPGLLLFIGSIVSAGCVKSKALLNPVVSAAVEFLSSDDWAARKAAAEVLEKLAASEKNLAAEFKSFCVAALESRRFDKVKIARETMNRALEMWKELPGSSEQVSSPKDSTSRGQSPGSAVLETPLPRKPVPISPLSATNTKKSIAKNEHSKQSIIPNANLRRNRVVPFNFNNDLGRPDAHPITNDPENEKEFEDLSLIRRQLKQIENQQSNLLDLLQRFIGSSQKGMSSLEKRVDGLERVLDEMSQDLAISTRRMSDCGGNTCCMIPGAEFLSPKFWRKAEGQTCNSRLSAHSLYGLGHKDGVAAEVSYTPRD